MPHPSGQVRRGLVRGPSRLEDRVWCAPPAAAIWLPVTDLALLAHATRVRVPGQDARLHGAPEANADEDQKGIQQEPSQPVREIIPLRQCAVPAQCSGNGGGARTQP